MNEREKLKQEILEELKKEYVLTPIVNKQFTVSDILDKYYEEICNTIKMPNNWQTKNSIGVAIRKVISLHFGEFNLKDIPVDKRAEVREELESFIRVYLLKQEKYW